MYNNNIISIVIILGTGIYMIILSNPILLRNSTTSFFLQFLACHNNNNYNHNYYFHCHCE